MQNVLLLIPDFALILLGLGLHRWLSQPWGGDGPGVAWLISVGTLAAMVTLSLWISQFG